MPDTLTEQQIAGQLREEKRRQEEEEENKQQKPSLRQQVAMARRMAASGSKAAGMAGGEAGGIAGMAKTAKKIIKGGRMIWVILGSSTVLLWGIAILAGLVLLIMIVSWMAEFEKANVLKQAWMVIKGVWDLLHGKFPAVESLFKS